MPPPRNAKALPNRCIEAARPVFRRPYTATPVHSFHDKTASTRRGHDAHPTAAPHK